MILILEYATKLTSSGEEQESALHQAQLQYIQFGPSSAATQFPAAFQNYSDAEFIQFILNNCLCSKQVPWCVNMTFDILDGLYYCETCVLAEPIKE